MPAIKTVNPERVLVADIGGTHARFGIANFTPGQSKPRIDNFHVFKCADHTGAESLLEQYLRQLTTDKPAVATLAIAGPVSDNIGTITNLGWPFDGKQLAEKLGFEALYIINDFSALAMSAPALEADDIVTIRNVEKPAKGPISVMGPGTGFGAAMLVPKNGDYTVIPSESGHISFAPVGALEGKIWQQLTAEAGRIPIESMLSGSGLVRIYKSLCAIHGETAQNYDPRTISEQAENDPDSICHEALSVFCNLLGSVAGDIALVQGARGGVFLGGGILPKVINFFLNSDFLVRFLDKGLMREYLESIPIHLIIAPDAALTGSAIYGHNSSNP